MRREIRKKEIKKRKNFFPLFGVTLSLWAVLGLTVYFVDPDTFGAVPFFILLTFVTLFFTFTTIFAHVRRGVIAAVAITIFVTFRYFGIGNILNIILLAFLALAIEAYFWYTSH